MYPKKCAHVSKNHTIHIAGWGEGIVDFKFQFQILKFQYGRKEKMKEENSHIGYIFYAYNVNKQEFFPKFSP